MRKRKVKMRAAAVGLFALAASVLLWSFLIEPATLRTVEYKIDVPGWPESFPEIKVAILADLHVGSPFVDIEKVREVVEQTNGVSPDLVLLPGDFVIQNVLGGEFVDPWKIADILSELKAPLGVWGVLGNHDWWHDAKAVRHAFEASGIPMLEDISVPLIHKGTKFWLTGISDYYEGPHDMERAFAHVPEGAPFLAMTHTPDIFPEYPKKSGLLIASHTHGGQVNIPFFGRPVVPSRYGERFAAGLIEENGKQMFVSTGIGTSIIPIRFRVPPEISILRLQ